MKILIWILCLAAETVIVTLLRDIGIYLGGIPTAILICLAIWGANSLCHRWDMRLLEKKAASKGITVIELARKSMKDEIWDRCEELRGSKELKTYLKQQLEWGTITKMHVTVLKHHFRY